MNWFQYERGQGQPRRAMRCRLTAQRRSQLGSYYRYNLRAPYRYILIYATGIVARDNTDTSTVILTFQDTDSQVIPDCTTLLDIAIPDVLEKKWTQSEHLAKDEISVCMAARHVWPGTPS